MASVPNMRLGPTARPGVADQPGDQAEGEGFAQLLSTTITTPGESEAPPQDAAAPSEEKPATGGQTDTPVAQAEAILSLVALQATPVTATATVSTTSPSQGTAGATATVAVPTGAPAGAVVQTIATPLDSAALAGTPATPTAPSTAGVVTVSAGTTPAPAGAVAAAPTSAASLPGQPAPASASQPNPLPGTSPLGSATADQSGQATPTVGQPSLTPTTGGVAGVAPGAPSPLPATAPAAAKAAIAALVKDGAPLAALHGAGPASPTTAVKVPTLARARAVAIDPAVAVAGGAATQAVAPGAGSRESVPQPSLNIAASKGDAVAAQAPSVQAATPAIPPFSPTALTEPAPATAPGAAAPVAVASPEAMIERQLDLAADGEWLDQLARDIASTGGAEGKMRFRLDPEHLGTLRVELAQSERGTSIRLTVETEAARAILADAQPKLAAEARAQGVRIADTHVDLAGGQAGDSRRHEAERRGQQLRTAHESSSQAEPERQAHSGSDRYA